MSTTAKALRINPPAQGQKITIRNGKLHVPDQPIIPFIEGDGTGPDIWRASVRVLDAAVQKAYGGKRKIHWMEVYAGQKSNDCSTPGCRTKQSPPAANTSCRSRAR